MAAGARRAASGSAPACGLHCASRERELSCAQLPVLWACLTQVSPEKHFSVRRVGRVEPGRCEACRLGWRPSWHPGRWLCPPPVLLPEGGRRAPGAVGGAGPGSTSRQDIRVSSECAVFPRQQEEGWKKAFLPAWIVHYFLKRLLKSKCVLIETRVPLACSRAVTMGAGEQRGRLCQVPRS